jgi:hypothetical protein
MPLDACIWPDNRARFGRLVLRITVEPWISPKTLEEFYRGMQQHWVEQKVLPARPKTRGKEGAARSWEVLAFHTARWYAAGQPLDDHALLAEWNATCPDAAYTTGDRPVRQLQQALHRAWDSVLYWKRKYGETAAPD